MTPATKLTSFSTTLAQVTDAVDHGAVIVLEETRIRIRRLPIVE
ncbi:MAG: hypothetical protein ACRD0L_09860 [Acidimicrobiales bacterium]